MGLDMYLNGRAFLWKEERRDGYRLREVEIELGYWRKHPNLHGYIVQHFAGGKDLCQDIPLTAENMIQIVAAIQDKALPETTGFFFGSSDGSEDEESIDIFLKAIKWLEGVAVFNPLSEPAVPIGGGMAIQKVDIEAVQQLKESRTVYYRASW